MTDATTGHSCASCGNGVTTYVGSAERGSGIHTLWACYRHLGEVAAQVRTIEDQEDFLPGLARRDKPGRKPPNS
ncbi:hypothetical protein [Streptomyces sp. DW26H14]|uniref:hypothetical protein n=1 Tax=Streptomyces sp. DW26H14 TaxID=3435395 RepID=UPI00403DD1B3